MKKDNVGVWQGIYQETHARNGRAEVRKGNIRVWQDIYKETHANEKAGKAKAKQGKINLRLDRLRKGKTMQG